MARIWLSHARAELLAIIVVGAVIGVGCMQASDAPASSSTTPTTRPIAKGAPVTLTITVTDLRSTKGKLIFGVFQTGDGFPSESSKALNWQVRQPDSTTQVFTAELPPGEYAASVLHDENANDKMDLGLFGIPQEGYGVTNNPKPQFRGATFQEATFTLPPQGAQKTISLQYF